MTPFLHELLTSSDAACRARSALLLGQIACPSSVTRLARRLTDSDRAVRVQSGIALACMGEPRGISVCAAALKADAPWIRYYAAYGLWCVNSPRAKAVLESSAHGQSELVTQAIEGALNTPYVAPPAVSPLPAKATVSPKPSPTQIWEQAADVFVRESDWWWHKGGYDQSIRCGEASILLDPEWVETYSVIAWLQWSMGRNVEAIGTLHRAVRAAPTDPDACFHLGYHHFNLKKYSAAEQPLRKSVELGGDHLARRTYAHCLEKLGKLEASLREWKALLEIRPGDGSAILNCDRLRKLIKAQRAD